MRMLVLAAACTALLGMPSADAREFKARSADGTEITGVADIPDRAWTTAVVFVPGTGLFNRAGQFGKSGTPRDAVFKDLADRLLKRRVARGGERRADARHARQDTARRPHDGQHA